MTNALSRLEQLLAHLLEYGSWLASIAIGLGLAFALVQSRFGAPEVAVAPSLRLATAGVILFILLPTLRVVAMLIVFVRDRDHRLALTAAVILTIILIGFLVGVRTASRIAG